LRGARDLVEARAYAELVLEPAAAEVESPETLAAFRELREAGIEPRVVVRELKAVGGDLKALRLALTGQRARAGARGGHRSAARGRAAAARRRS
jgi:hypothetical protein